MRKIKERQKDKIKREKVKALQILSLISPLQLRKKYQRQQDIIQQRDHLHLVLNLDNNLQRG